MNEPIDCRPVLCADCGREIFDAPEQLVHGDAGLVFVCRECKERFMWCCELASCDDEPEYEIGGEG